MIEKIDFQPTLVSPDMQVIAEKLNEVIDVVNSRAILERTNHPEEVAEVCERAVRTGSHADFKAWLELRRKYL